MNNPSQEDLLGYVLGALDATEQRNLQKQLDQQPETEDQLLDIKSSLVPLDLLDAPGHRPGLARRTCEMVANTDLEEATRRLEFLDRPVSFDDLDTSGLSPEPTKTKSSSLDRSIDLTLDSTAPEAPSSEPVKIVSPVSGSWHPGNWSFNDALVGVACLAVLAGVLFPVVSWSRYQSRITACQNNLREVGTAFMTYSSLNEKNQFVAIPEEGNLSASGCYGPILKDAGLLNDDSLLACAGLGSNVAPVFIPSCKQVMSANAEEASYLKTTMGGHFGHTMGHRKNNSYVAPKNGQAHAVLLADRPSTNRPGRVSLNHGGNGQNCLFADGRVVFVKGHAYGSDALFENDYGVVAPGSTDHDNVIAASHLSPIIAVQLQVSPVE